MTTKEFAKILQDKLTSEYGVDLSVASHQQIYRALALICRQMMSENHKKFQSKAIGTGSKQVYYLCMEFLMGRSLKMSLFNLGLNDAAQKALAEADISLDSIYEEEPDAGLGNGGLGRLAACYLDSMATTSICGTGYSTLYEYGIFKQKIVDGWQQERADNCCPAVRSGSRAIPIRPWKSASTARSTRTGTMASTISSTPTTTASWPSPLICTFRVTTERALQSCVCGRPRLPTLICPASLWATATPQ